VHPQTLPLSATLGSGIQLRGTVSPSIPGLNTFMVGLATTGTAPEIDHIDLVITMLGMAMTPIHGRLDPHDGSFVGQVRLPMFGQYRAQGTSVAAGGNRSGSFDIMLPL
jgi:hypothetical protein